VTGFDAIIGLDELEVIDLVERPQPTLLDVVRSPIVRRTATRALEDLDTHHDSGPWVALCTETAEVVAASRVFDPSVVDEVRKEIDRYPHWECDRVPLVVLGLGEIRSVSPDAAASAAAEVVVRALCDVVLAEYRAAVATARTQQAEALAATDALTGLGNQRAWWERIAEEDARIHRSDTSAVVAVIDLDDLKTVNDEQGHLHGDLLLRLAAQTLREAVRSCDHVARVGGDEFAVLAVDFDGPPSVLHDRLAAALERADIRASVGVAAPHQGSSLLDAYARADEAMYADKRGRANPPPTGTDG
jgi:diguanylate cyclase (GGDEF)-like protein